MVCNAITNMGLKSGVDHLLQKVFNQNFIFPDPEVFSCRYIPLETQANHQLTKYISFDQWKRQPIIYPAFCKFDCRLRPSFNEKYICQVENGTATFFLDMAKERASEDVGVPFELFLLDDDKNEYKMQRCVFMTRAGEMYEHFGFEIRIPRNGIYVFKLYVQNAIDTEKQPLIDVCFQCQNITKNFIKPELPILAGPEGWGCGPTAARYGFYLPSHKDNTIALYTMEEALVQFQYTGDGDVTVQLCHRSTDDETLQDYYDYDLNEDRGIPRTEVNISMKIPEEGEYALQIGVHGESGELVVCNYLVLVKEKQRGDWAIRRLVSA